MNVTTSFLSSILTHFLFYLCLFSLLPQRSCERLGLGPQQYTLDLGEETAATAWRGICTPLTWSAMPAASRAQVQLPVGEKLFLLCITNPPAGALLCPNFLSPSLLGTLKGASLDRAPSLGCRTISVSDGGGLGQVVGLGGLRTSPICSLFTHPRHCPRTA